MTDASGDLSAWLAHIQELTKSSKPRDEMADERGTALFAEWLEATGMTGGDVKSRMFGSDEMKSPDKDSDKRREELLAKLMGSANTTGNGARSLMLDSPEMESYHSVELLTKKPDGTTVVHYYFASDPAQANGLCRSDAAHLECTPLIDDRTKKLAREAMRDIVAESGAKIEFNEVYSLQQADITFVRSPRVIEAGGQEAVGYAGRGGDKNVVVDAMYGAIPGFRQLAERELSSLSLEQREALHRTLLEKYGEKYGENADILTIVLSEAEKRTLAHEVEHMLGAKHPDTRGGIIVTENSNPDDFNQSIMGGGLGMARDLKSGKMLGDLDIEWYRRHFGVRDFPVGELPAPSPIQTDSTGKRHER